MLRRRLPATIALALTGGAIVWALTGLPGAPAACPAAGCDCEAAGKGSLKQPANAWSSLALAAAGIALLMAFPTAAGEARPAPAGRGGGSRGPTIHRACAAYALVVTGIVAFLFHAGLTAWAARLDGIAVGILIAALAVHRWWPRAATSGFSPPVVGEMPAGQRGGHNTVASHGPPDFVLPPPGEEGWSGGHGVERRTAAALVPASAQALLPWLLLAVGGLCWLLGRSGGPWCRPGSLLQAHAAWHLLAATALLLWLGRGARMGPPASRMPPHPLASGREDYHRP